MFGSGAGRDRINSLVLVIISSKSDNRLDGGLYTRIIIRSGLCKSHTELEYFRQFLWIRFLLKYIHTPPPGLETLSLLTIMKPWIWTSLSSIPSCRNVSHKHMNIVDESQ